MNHKMAWAEVNTGAVLHNLSLVRKQIGGHAKICAVLKGDAYGHGMVPMARLLVSEGVADMIAVGKTEELVVMSEELTAMPGVSAAISGEDSAGRTEILLLGEADAGEVENLFRDGRINPDLAIFSIFSLRQFEEFRKLGERLGVRLRLHVRIDEWDSGMGIGYEEFLGNEAVFFSSGSVEVCGLYAHLYSSYFADHEKTKEDLEGFDAFVRRIRPEHREKLTVHVMNSALIFRFPQYAYDMARAGAAIYGLPCGDGGRLRGALRIMARVFYVREVPLTVPLSYHPAGEFSAAALSSGGEWERKQSRDSQPGHMQSEDIEPGHTQFQDIEPGRIQSGDSQPEHARPECMPQTRKIARMMIGYGDCPLLLTQKDVRVEIRGRSYPLADDVCMDNLCVDVTGSENIVPGDIAVLYGGRHVTADQIMERNGMQYVHSDWLCMTSWRLEKRYV
jgi:alanine racemase